MPAIEVHGLTKAFRTYKKLPGFAGAVPGPQTGFLVVANLPYYISTAILQRLIEQREAFTKMVLMLQREVVERITAKVGSSERGFLTVLVEAYTVTEKLFDVSPDAFRPVPKVWSSVVSVKPKAEIELFDPQNFRKIVSFGFRHKRKTILNNLKNSENSSISQNALSILETLQIDQNRRAETLTVKEWIGLSKFWQGK